MSIRVGLDCRALGNINRNRGIGRYTASLVESLIANRDGFDLVGFGYGDGSDPGLLDPGAFEELEWRQMTEPGAGSIYGGPREHVKFAREVKESGVSLFHGIDHNMTPLLSCPSLVTVHDLIPLVLRGPYLGPKSWTWMRAHRTACRRADLVVAVSEATRDDVARIWKISPGKIAVVAEGVSRSYRPIGDAPVAETLERYRIRRPYFLYLGGLDPRKNIGNMLLGFKRFRLSSDGDACMVLCGEITGFEDYLLDLIDELGLRDDVLLPGFVCDEDLPAVYSGAVALVFVSVYEGFGLPLLEAMACGTPVLASDVSSIPGVVGDAALLVDPLEPGAIASGLAIVAYDKEKRSSLISRGLKRASAFTWEKAASEILDLYRTVLGGASR